MRAMQNSLDSLSYPQRERLAYLEVKVFFTGELRRSDLEARFDIKPAAATRDMNAYRAIAPDNLVYDASAKAYCPSKTFVPVFAFSATRILSWLLNGFGDGPGVKPRRAIPCEGPGDLVEPDFNVLAGLTRAVHAGMPVQISYLSLSSGAGKRTIVPVALADNGARWHVRAYDRKQGRFADFVLTRITKVEPMLERVEEHETIKADSQWSRIVDLKLVPHPALPNSEAIVADYSMKEGMLKLSVRAALAGYALNRWNVDTTPDHCLDPKRYHLWLSNPETLDGVESAVLAPGYLEEALS